MGVRSDAWAWRTRGKSGGEVKDFAASQWIAPKDVKKMDPFVHYGVAAALMSIADAGLEIRDADAERIGVAIGAGIGGLKGIEETAIKYHEGGPRKISPFYVPSTIINMVAGQVSIMTGAKGPNIAAVTACTTATHNIGLAMRMIQYGDADVMIAGGARGERGDIEAGDRTDAREGVDDAIPTRRQIVAQRRQDA